VKHYSLSQWTDFARRVTVAAENEEMQEHLDGCQRCKSVVKAFESVADFAKRESAYTPFRRYGANRAIVFRSNEGGAIRCETVYVWPLDI
jgi:hypothetical protein